MDFLKEHCSECGRAPDKNKFLIRFVGANESGVIIRRQCVNCEHSKDFTVDRDVLMRSWDVKSKPKQEYAVVNRFCPKCETRNVTIVVLTAEKKVDMRIHGKCVTCQSEFDFTMTIEQYQKSKRTIGSDEDL